jgi:hypothetical protein
VLQGVGSDSDTFRVGADGLRRRRRSESSLRLLRKDGGVTGNGAPSRDGAAGCLGRIGVLSENVDGAIDEDGDKLPLTTISGRVLARKRAGAWLDVHER